MTAVSVVQIDVRDKAFKDFQKSFDKYQAALANQPVAWSKVSASFAAHKKQLGSMPATWGSIGKAANAASQPFIKIAAAVSVMNARLKAAPTFVGKIKVVAQSVVGIFDKIAKGTFTIVKNIGRATVSLLKWAGLTALVSGLLGGGGLFGIDRLALSASNSRRQSQGLGVRPGDLKSAQINFSKFSDVDSTLENIANSRSDLSKRWIFSALGIDPNKGSNVDVMGASLKAAKHSFEQSGMTQQGADAHGLTQLYSMDDLRRLHAMTDQEIDDAVKKQQADRETLAVSDKTLRSWQDLSIQLERASTALENLFINKLSSLTGPIGKLSDAVSNAFAVFLDSPKIGEWITSFGDSLQQFAKYLTSDEFKSDMENFVSAIKQVSEALYKGFVWLGVIKPTGGGPAHPAATPSPKSKAENWVSSVTASGERKFGGVAALNHNPGNLRSWGDTPVVNGFAKFSSDADGLRAMGDQLQLYKKRGNDTLAGIIKKWAPASENDTNAYIRDVAGKTGFKDDEHLDLNNREVLAKLMAGMTKHENASSNFSPSAISAALGTQSSGPVTRGTQPPILVEVRNNTGGSAIVTTNALAQ